MKFVLKRAAIGVWMVLLLPFAIVTAFGRIKPLYTLFAHAVALLPGMPGDYARTAYYFMTLRQFSLDSRILFGSFFAHIETSVGPGVVINPYCILGRCSIGPGCQIAANTYILSGTQQHIREHSGRLQEGIFQTICIGRDCWIGASSVIMADVGDGATIGAGSIVTRAIPAGATAVGNPARVLKPDIATNA